MTNNEQHYFKVNGSGFNRILKQVFVLLKGLKRLINMKLRLDKNHGCVFYCFA